MKKFFHFCKVSTFMAALICVGSCSLDWGEEVLHENSEGLSIEEAKSYFEDAVMDATTRTLKQSAHPMMWDLGEIVPDWSKGTSTISFSLLSADVPIESSTYRYRVLQTDKETGKKRNVKCYQKLVIAKNRKTGRMGNYIVYFIATNKYSKENRGIISDWFNNDGNMGDFSGVKIYTTLEGRMVRVNKFENGRKMKGIYLGAAATKNEYAQGLLVIMKMMRNMHLQRGITTGIVTRSGEGGDWDYGDGSGYVDLDNGFYYDDDYDVFLYDYDEDGNPDSVWVPDVDIIPDDPLYPDESDFDPDPFPEPDDSDTTNWWDDTDYSGNSDYLPSASCRNLSQAQLLMPLMLKRMGVDISNIKIKDTPDCLTGYARRDGGDIAICSKFYTGGLSLYEQAGVVYHEVYHIRNDDPIRTFIKNVNMQLGQPPVEIMNYLRSKCEGNIPTGYTSWDEVILKVDLAFYSMASPEYYSNEINAYKAEIEKITYVTTSYDMERKYNLWAYERKYELSKANY